MQNDQFLVSANAGKVHPRRDINHAFFIGNALFSAKFEPAFSAQAKRKRGKRASRLIYLLHSIPLKAVNTEQAVCACRIIVKHILAPFSSL
jgi:hypothetical protein